MCRMFQVYVGICAQEAGMNMRRLRHSALKTEKRSLKVHLHQVRIAVTKLPKVIWTDRIAGMADFFYEGDSKCDTGQSRVFCSRW